MQAEALRGAPVVSVADGTLLGRVEDLIFDLGALRAVALRVAVDRRHVVVPFGELRAAGPDAVTVPSARSVEGYGELFAGLPTLDRLHHLKVVDESGVLDGVVRGLDIDPRTGQIVSARVHHGGFAGFGGRTASVPRDAILSVGDVMVVSAAAGLDPEADDDPSTAVERRGLERER